MCSKISSFNPCSNKFHAGRDFKDLSPGQKAGTIILTVAAGIFTVGIGALPVFCLLVGRFKKSPPEKSNETTEGVERSRNEVLNGEKKKKSSKSSTTESEATTTEETPSSSEAYPEDDDFDGLFDEDLEKMSGKEQTKKAAPGARHGDKRRRLLAGCLDHLTKIATGEGKEVGQAIDNGDCFYDSFAQCLNRLLGMDKTAKDMRMEVSAEANRINDKNPNTNWIRKALESEVGAVDSYASYLKDVHLDCQEVLDRGMPSPVWGRAHIDGKILCSLYNVNLWVLEVGDIDDIDADPFDEATYWSNEPEEQFIHQDEHNEHTVELGLIPNHFVPIFE